MVQESGAKLDNTAQKILLQFGGSSNELRSLFEVIIRNSVFDYNSSSSLLNEHRQKLVEGGWSIETPMMPEIRAIATEIANSRYHIGDWHSEKTDRKAYIEKQRDFIIADLAVETIKMHKCIAHPELILFSRQNLSDDGNHDTCYLDFGSNNCLYDELKSFAFSELIRKRFGEYSSSYSTDRYLPKAEIVKGSTFFGGKDGGAVSFLAAFLPPELEKLGYNLPEHNIYIKSSKYVRMTA